MTKRYVVRDALAGTCLDLIAPGDMRRRERWEILDTTTNLIVDAFASKRAATDTARDMNEDHIAQAMVEATFGPVNVTSPDPDAQFIAGTVPMVKTDGTRIRATPARAAKLIEQGRATMAEETS